MNTELVDYVKRLEREAQDKEWQRQLQSRSVCTNTANWNPPFRTKIPATFVEEGAPVGNTTRLYEVLIVDSRLGDGDTDAVKSFYVRAKAREDARMRALLRSHYDEKDIKHLDLIALELVDVKPYVGDGGGDD